MREESSVSTVIRYKDYDNDYVYVGSTSEGTYQQLYIGEVYDLKGAKDFSDCEREHISEVYDLFQQENSQFECEVVRISTTTVIEDVMEDDEVYKELRQKAALAKLSEKEIKALGLTSIAVYIKTKYHNA